MWGLDAKVLTPLLQVPHNMHPLHTADASPPRVVGPSLGNFTFNLAL